MLARAVEVMGSRQGAKFEGFRFRGLVFLLCVYFDDFRPQKAERTLEAPVLSHQQKLAINSCLHDENATRKSSLK